MEDIIQNIDDLMEELTTLKENDNFNKSQLDDVIYELDSIKEIIDESIEN